MFHNRIIFALYRALTAALSPLFLLYVLWRVVRDRRYQRGVAERFGMLPVSFQRTVRDSIWLHAVSVGEVLSAVELVRRLREALPVAPVFVSVGTLAGREAAEAKLNGVADGVFYAPFDVVWAIRRVIRRIRPAAVVVLETEIWPNLWREAKRAGCALVVVNGRISDKARDSYRRRAWFFGPVLGLADALLVQSEQDRERYLAAGAPAESVHVGGNVKYDFHPGSAVPPDVVREWAERGPGPLWIAASTVAPEFEGDVDEDDAVIAAWKALPGTRVLVAPRKPERFDVAAAKWAAAGIRIARRTSLPANADAPVLLLDSIGELSSTFPYARVVFMGGTLARRGGHNILEPALFGKPVVVGTSLENFAAIQRRFRDADAFVEIGGPGELAPAVDRLLADPGEFGEKARRLAESERGATQRAVDAIVEARWHAVPRTVPFWPLWWLSGVWVAGGWLKRAFTRSRRLKTPVVSVGGLSMGGVGKTPVVRLLARSLPGAAVLTRGYRRRDPEPVTLIQAGSKASVHQTGDEAQMILRDGFAHVGIGGDRYRVGRKLEKKWKPRVFLLDDGFQHARLKRDLDVVVLDGLDPFGGGCPFPAGWLREPLSALSRASVVVIARSEGRRFDGVLRMLPRGVPVFYGRTEAVGWLDLRTGERLPLESLKGRPVVAFCGLGNPEAFRRTLAGTGCVIAEFRAFGDHYAYSESDLQRLEGLGSVLVTTEKDAMRLPRPVGFVLLVEAVVPGLEEYIAFWLRSRVVTQY